MEAASRYLALMACDRRRARLIGVTAAGAASPTGRTRREAAA